MYMPGARPMIYRAADIEYRRELRWRIFAWGSTLLTAITGGLAALKLGALGKNFTGLTTVCEAILVSVIFILGFLACFWLGLNLRQEERLRGVWRDQPECKNSPIRDCGTTEGELKLGWFNVVGVALLALAAIISVIYDFN